MTDTTELRAELAAVTAREAVLREALAMWVAYDDLADAAFSGVEAMLLYADAVALARAALKETANG